jgi:glyoxylase I family protein
MPTTSGAHHVAFTVQDVGASAAWYQDSLGLREYPAHADGTFSEFRTGLDHIAFTVPSRDDLESWQGLLAEKGITFSPIADSPLGSLIALRDPDNIQLELWLPPGEDRRGPE